MKKISLLFMVAMSLSVIGCNPTKGGGGETPEPPTPEPPSPGERHDVDIDVPELVALSEPAVYFHYWRQDCTYTNWDMWIWEKDHDGAAFNFNYKDNWGVVAAYTLSSWEDPLANTLGFIVRKGGDTWADKDLGGSDKYLDFSLFTADENGSYHVYLISGQTDIYIDPEGHVKGTIKQASFPKVNILSASANLGMTSWSLRENGVEIMGNPSTKNIRRIYQTLPEGKTVDFAKKYELYVTFEDETSANALVSKFLLFGSEEFGNLYNYEGDDLGVEVDANGTTFKVWSPLSSSVKLRVYDSGTPAALTGGDDTHQEYEMTKEEKGVWSYHSTNQLYGKYYTYVVTNEAYTEKETVDPYAKSAGINGSRGAIVNFEETNPTEWDSIQPLPFDRKEMVVYETHVADVTSSSTWTGTETNRKLFNGMYEKGTKYTENGNIVSTGFDHIASLGVNAVQILPLYDQANDEVNPSFNWGYNPLNYNVIEGSYSSNPYDAAVRVREFKELVKAYNKEGMNIIMDVVYNHVAGAQGCNFDVLVPGYYFRYNDNGSYSNGSGCGNETASEHFMMRKFMIDSACFWTKEYKLGGFRFDLMGLHDLETMAQLTSAVKQLNPSAVIYGEPWSGGTSPLPDSESAKQINGNKYQGYGAFNDKIRDGLIKGGLAGPTELGWITNNKTNIGNDINMITRGIKGITAAGTAINDPDKTVNYVTCHDNRTLYDRFIATKKFTAEQDELLEKMNVLANAVIMLSEGTSFMLAGEEFLRTKQGNENSYNASYEVNELDYSLKIKHPRMMENYQKLIQMKTLSGALHLDQEKASAINIKASSDGSMISYKIVEEDINRETYIIHANGLPVENTVDLTGYTLYWSTLEGNAKEISAATPVGQYETIIAYRNL